MRPCSPGRSKSPWAEGRRQQPGFLSCHCLREASTGPSCSEAEQAAAQLWCLGVTQGILHSDFLPASPPQAGISTPPTLRLLFFLPQHRPACSCWWPVSCAEYCCCHSHLCQAVSRTPALTQLRWGDLVRHTIATWAVRCWEKKQPGQPRQSQRALCSRWSTRAKAGDAAKTLFSVTANSSTQVSLLIPILYQK